MVHGLDTIHKINAEAAPDSSSPPLPISPAPPPPSRFDHWCILEIMGHNRYAGRVTEQTIAGVAFIRIDVPSVGGLPAFSKLVSPASVYGLTPTTEELARGVAENLGITPISIYDLPAEMKAKLQSPSPRSLPSPRENYDARDMDDDHYCPSCGQEDCEC